jgi:hypothetical protein
MERMSQVASTALTDIDSRHLRSQTSQAQRILPCIALQMDDREPLDVAQQFPLFRVEGAPTSAKKGHLITFVTVMSHRCLIPRETILFVKVFAHVTCSFLSFLE